MRTKYVLIDKDGELINPTTQPFFNLEIPTVDASQFANQITLVFYDGIDANNNPINPVIEGITGTVQILVKADTDSAWQNIYDNNSNPIVIDIANDSVLQIDGVIVGLKAICNNVAGCNYILIKLDRSYGG